MAPLFKKKDKTTIAELEEYYANQNQRRSSTAWLMALLSILITIAVVVALFFLGRWIYQTFIQDDAVVVVDTTETTDGDSVDLPNFDSEELGSDRGVEFTEGDSNNPDDLIVDDSDVTQSQSDSSDDGTVSDEAASTDVPNTDRLAGDQDTAVSDSSTGGEDGSVAGAGTSGTDASNTASAEDEEIPDTGAGEMIIVLLAATGLLGYLGAQRYQLKK